MKTYADTYRYRNFIAARDRALERLRNNAQLRISSILSDALNHAIQIVTHRYSTIPKDSFFTNYASDALRGIDQQIEAAFNPAAKAIWVEFMRLRRFAYLLSGAGETEALARATGDYKQSHISRTDLDRIATSKTLRGEDLHKRILLGFSEIRRDMMHALETSRVMEEALNDTITRVTRAMPRAYVMKRPAKILKTVNRVTEAKKGQVVKSVSARIVDESDWDDMLTDYLSGPEIPKQRFFNEEPTIYSEGEDVIKGYNWQIEQELTNDFVDMVRQGQVDEAKKNGVKDFIWVAILDDLTCEKCCRWRDGLTTEEIQSQLDGKHADDDCEALVPPAHFNCRCTLAPVGDVPESIDVDFGDFEDWLGK